MRRASAERIADEIARDWRHRLEGCTLQPGANPNARRADDGWVVRVYDREIGDWVTWAMPHDWRRWQAGQRRP